MLCLLQCNTLQKDKKDLRSKNELLEQELKQAKEKVAAVTKVILIYLINHAHLICILHCIETQWVIRTSNHIYNSVCYIYMLRIICVGITDGAIKVIRS